MKKERFTLATAVHVFLLQDDRILMLRRFNTGYEDGSYSVIAGHLDGDEEVVEAACREAYEEAGIRLEPESVEVVGVMHRKSNDERIDFFVTAKRWEGEVRNAEPEKCDDLSWFPLHALPSNTIPYVRQAIENFRTNVWFCSYGWKK